MRALVQKPWKIALRYSQLTRRSILIDTIGVNQFVEYFGTEVAEENHGGGNRTSLRTGKVQNKLYMWHLETVWRPVKYSSKRLQFDSKSGTKGGSVLNVLVST